VQRPVPRELILPGASAKAQAFGMIGSVRDVGIGGLSLRAIARVSVLVSLAAFAWLYWHESDIGWAHLAHALRAMYEFSAKNLADVSAFKTLAIISLVLAFEPFVIGWKNSSIARLLLHRRWTAMLDCLWLAVTLFNLAFFLEVIFTFGGSILLSRFFGWVSSHYQWTRLTLPSDGIFEIAFSLSIFWLVTSFVQYWGHRLMHTALFWHLHRFHHAATELNMITVFRVHPVEPVALQFVTVVSPLAFLNVPDQIILLYFPVAVVADLLAHSQLRWDYGWLGRWVIQSPRVHQVHHSIDEEHQDLHFSNCPLWDHLFGTWYNGTKQPSSFGISDPAYELRPLTQLLGDAWIFYANLTCWIVSSVQRLRARTFGLMGRRSSVLQARPALPLFEAAAPVIETAAIKPVWWPLLSCRR
jgi:sterol desaturase/sphingolipid hydroxylase (fatty acid hydroxylase superfamily)